MQNQFKKAIIVASLFLAQSAMAGLGGQVFYHYGQSTLDHDRGHQVFTDTNGTTSKNDDTKGWNIGAGLDLPLLKAVGPGDVLGEVMVDYAHHSKKTVNQTTSALLGATTTKEVTVSTLNVTIAPKYNFTGIMDGKLTPWVIPVGLSFLVNSPPSDNTTYLDVGYHAAVGVDYKVLEELSLGLDYRKTFASKDIDVDNSYSTLDFYVGINF